MQMTEQATRHENAGYEMSNQLADKKLQNGKLQDMEVARRR